MSLPTDDRARKALPMWTYLTEFFPDAFLAVVDVAVKGNEQHSPGKPLHWARGKSTDQLNTAARHMFDHSTGTARDVDGTWHLAKAIWRLSAQLQTAIEAATAAPAADSGEETVLYETWIKAGSETARAKDALWREAQKRAEYVPKPKPLIDYSFEDQYKPGNGRGAFTGPIMDESGLVVGMTPFLSTDAKYRNGPPPADLGDLRKAYIDTFVSLARNSVLGRAYDASTSETPMADVVRHEQAVRAHETTARRYREARDKLGAVASIEMLVSAQKEAKEIMAGEASK